MVDINFVSHATETLASHRMRVLKPVELLNEDGEFEASWSDEVDADAEVVVFQKHINPQYDAHMMNLLVDSNRIVFDICDDHFNGKLADHYKRCCRLADVVTVNSENLRDVVKEATGKDALLVNDPITFPYKQALSNVNRIRNPKLLWYGHATNIGPLQHIAENCTEDLMIIVNDFHVESDRENVQSMLWEPNLVESVIENYDFVLLPLAQDKQNKNTNRAVDALVAGRFVIADSERVYGELKDFIWIGDILEGIEWARSNPDEVKRMVKLGQEYVMEVYSDARILKQWKGVINAAKPNDAVSNVA